MPAGDASLTTAQVNQKNPLTAITVSIDSDHGIYRGVNDLFAQGLAGEIIEPVAGAMRRDQNIGIDLFKCFNCLADVVVAERRHDMETADDGVHLVDPGNFLSPLDGVDHAAMAARCQNDQ